MRIDDELTLSYYQKLSNIDNKPHITLVKHIETGRLYVKKILKTYNMQVFSALKDMNIPGTPQIFHLIEDGDTLIVIEEYINGDSLADILDERGPFDEKNSWAIILGLCKILSVLHKHNPPIVHRDIKPANVILTRDEHLYLIDFGIAKCFNESQHCDTVIMGTNGYAAPEQYGYGQSGPAADIYSLGVLFNKLLTDSLPVQNIYSGRYSKIIRKCINLNTSERFASVEKLSDAIRKINKKSRVQGSHTGIRAFTPPGFRTGKPWKIVLASLSYIIVFLFTMSYMPEKTDVSWSCSTADIILERCWIFSSFFFAVAISCNYMGIASFLPPCNSRRLWLRIPGCIIWTSVYITVWVLLINVIMYFAA